MPSDPRFLRPWRLLPQRVRRFYRGGRLLEVFRGAAVADARDGDRPEDWVGSVTRAWTPPGAPLTEDGLADAEVDGRRFRILDALATDPIGVAGAPIVERFGATTGILVKLLDAAVRLPIHAHPSRAFARRHLGSPFGKAEAWIVLATRSAADDPQPTVRIGFQRDVGRGELIDWIEAGRTEQLLDAMHERPTGPGDVWFIPPGVPHAIGAGIFMLEVEEPSDFSMVAETRDVPVDPADAHLRLGWDVTIGAFDRAGHDDAWLDRLRISARSPGALGSPDRRDLTGIDAAPYFRAERVVIDAGSAPVSDREAFAVGVVTAGSGRVVTSGGELPIAAGDTFAVPAAALPSATVETEDRLELVCCLPPRPEDVDA